MDRVVPASIEAEAALLGAIMMNGGKWGHIRGTITKDDFHRPAHSVIYDCCCKQEDEGKPIDLVTLPETIKNLQLLDSIGGLDYLVDLCEGCPTLSSMDAYAEIVKQKATARELIRTCQETEARAYDNVDVAELTDSLVDKGVEMRRALGHETTSSCSLASIADRLAENAQRPARGVSTGYGCIDERLVCLNEGRVYTLAGFTGSGKSALATNIARNVARQYQDGLVLFFSLEMSEEEIGQRLVSIESNIPHYVWEKGKATDAQAQQVRDTALRYPNLEMVYGNISMKTIEDHLKRFDRPSMPIKLVVIDYLQLITGDDKLPIRERISKFTRKIKNLAGQYSTPVIQLSQLRRPVERYSLPHLYMLKESGSIEQDSDVVIMLGQPEEDVLAIASNYECEERWLKIEKARNGKVTEWPKDGMDGIKLKWYSQCTRFEGES